MTVRKPVERKPAPDRGDGSVLAVALTRLNYNGTVYQEGDELRVDARWIEAMLDLEQVMKA